LSKLRGTPVAGSSSLQDVVLGPDWAIVEVVLEESEGPRRVPLDGLVLPPRGESRRASWLPRRRSVSGRASRYRLWGTSARRWPFRLPPSSPAPERAGRSRSRTTGC